MRFEFLANAFPRWIVDPPEPTEEKSKKAEIDPYSNPQEMLANNRALAKARPMATLGDKLSPRFPEERFRNSPPPR
jgi:hypothetical protein